MAVTSFTAKDGGGSNVTVYTNSDPSTGAKQDTGNTSLGTLAGAVSSARVLTNPIVGQAGIAAGTGVDGVTVPRVSLATNVPLPAGTNAIGKLSANSGVDIGDVDVTSLPSLPAGANAIGSVTVTSLPALVAGTAAIGKLAANSGVDIGDVDVTSLPALAAGTALIGKVGIDQTTPGTTNNVSIISGQNGIAGGTGVDGATVPRVSLVTNVALPAGELHVGQVGGHTNVVDVTLSLDTSAYSSGDVLAETQQVDAALRKTDGTGTIWSMMVIDKDDQKAAFTVYFLSANSSMGTENSAPGISDANAATILGFVDVAVGDYRDLGGVSVAFLTNVGVPVKAVSGTDDLYVAVVNGTGTPTYTASGVVLRLGIVQD